MYGKVDGGMEYFQWLKDIRDAYAAHKFGALRECVVGVIVDPSSSKMLGIGDLVKIYMGPADKEGRHMMLSFMQIAVAHVDNLVKDNKARLIEEAKNLSPAELKALPVGRVHGVGSGEVRMTRTKLQKARDE